MTTTYTFYRSQDDEAWIVCRDGSTSGWYARVPDRWRRLDREIDVLSAAYHRVAIVAAPRTEDGPMVRTKIEAGHIVVHARTSTVAFWNDTAP